MRVVRLGVAAMAFVGGVVPAFADVLPRASTADGAVIERKSGEEVQFVESRDWQGVEVNQDLLAGDTLRTNALGSLAIRFADKTLVRMARETVLRVRKIDGTSDSLLNLEGGTIWGRAERGGSGIVIDTPAAAAAIRGTDWSLNTTGNRTTLTVLEGTVELRNAHGSIVVNQGEGAVATLGEAPRKYVLVNLEEREQILLYGEIRDMFITLPVSDESTVDARGERRRLLERPEASRSREDWLKLAELALAADGRRVAQDALSRLPRPLPGALEARAVLVEALIAGNALRYDEAIRLFREARPKLSGERRVMADYGEWIASSLAYPDKKTVPAYLARTPATPGEAAVQASVVAHLRGQTEAIALLQEAERRFPDDAGLPAMRASLALQLDRREEARTALDRARSIDPDDVAYLTTNARYRSVMSSDLDGALADLKRAVEIAPGDDAAWDEIGLVQSDRNAPIEADAAHRRAASLNPENVAVRANYARFLMDNDQMAAAKRELDAAEALDPTSYAVLAAKGRYLLRLGKTAEGEKVLQDAAAVNPTYGDALIGLAIANYQSGSSVGAAQALDNADRFDRDNPSISLMRAGIAMDEYHADDAIQQAREALRRRQARGGYYTGYDANQQVLSYLGLTLENVGLREWGRFYADKAFDPFVASSYVDESSEGRIIPFVGRPLSALDGFAPGSNFDASQLQARMLSPFSIASEAGRNALENRNFIETTIGSSLLDQNGELGWSSDINVEGMSYAAVPFSYHIQADISRSHTERENSESNLEGGLFEIGLRPTLADNVYIFGNTFRQETGYPGQLWTPAPFTETETYVREIGGAWSHIISDRNIVQAFAVASDTDLDQQYREFGDELDPTVYRSNEASEQRSFVYGLSHLVGLGPVTLRYGAEAAETSFTVSKTATDLSTGETFYLGSLSGDNSATRIYADGLLDISTDLKLQAGLYSLRFDGEAPEWGPVDTRVGVSWAPDENHWLRAYYRQDTQFPGSFTLSPVSTVGLAPMQLPSYGGTQTETTAVRWDAEWNERLFTAVEYQHMRFHGLALTPEDMLADFLTWSGTIDRLNFSVNYLLGDGLGAFGSFTWNESKDTTDFWDPSLRVPLIPDYVAQFGLTYVHPSRISATIAHSIVGSRIGAQFYENGAPVGIELKPYSTTDAAIGWKSESGHLEAALRVLNIFNNDIDMADGLPAPGRTVLASITARF